MAVDGVKLILSLIQYQGIYYSMMEPYLLFNNRYNLPSRAESIYFFDKFEQPIHTLLHRPSWNEEGKMQTTALYQPFRQPIFVNQKIPDLSKMKHPEFPDLKFPMINTPWLNNDNTIYSYVQLFHMFKFEKVYPEYLWGHYGEVLPQPQVPHHLWLKTLELFSEWYEEVDTFHG
jgi:hypothetical protein